MARAFIGLGANLGAPEAQVRAAIASLGDMPSTRLVRASSLYCTAPVGGVAQPDFINAVAEIDTDLAPRDLLNALQAIETRAGRERPFANAPRTLDLDVLLYEDRVIREPDLEIPHPRMHERAFVLAPLVELDASIEIPGRGRAADLFAAVRDQRVEKA